MIQFPSDRSDHNQQHVAGSQKAADEQLARNMKRAARRQRGLTVVLTGAMLELVVFACVMMFLLSIVITFLR